MNEIERPYDVFVSYAQADNRPGVESIEGWVDQFVKELSREIRVRSGVEPKLFFDKTLDCSHPFDEQIFSALKSAKSLVVVASPSYFNSSWCEREREAFRQETTGRLANGRRVFVVKLLKLEGRESQRFFEVPPEFTHLLGYDFWALREVGTTATLDPSRVEDKPTYKDKMAKLAQNIVDSWVVPVSQKAATSRKKLESATDARVDVQESPAVFLAEATDDIQHLRESVRDYLEQFGIKVLPREPLPVHDAKALRGELASIMPRCHRFVQLLSEVTGRFIEPGSTAAFIQCESARMAGLPICQWRDSGVTESHFDEVSARWNHANRIVHRALLFGATVETGPLEDFKSRVKQHVDSLIAARRRIPRSPPGPTVFVDYYRNSTDHDIAMRLAQVLIDEHQCCVLSDVEDPDEVGSPQSVLEEQEQYRDNILNSQGAVVIFGDVGARKWANARMKRLWRLRSEVDDPPPLIALGLGPPPKEMRPISPIGVAFPGLEYLDLSQGVNPAEMASFVERLRETGPRRQAKVDPPSLLVKVQM